MKQITNLIILFLIVTAVGCSSDVFQISDNEYVPPTVKFQPRLMYPKIAQEHSFTGTSTVILFVTKEGIVEKVEISESTGSDILDEASLKYCKDLQFYPATRFNKPVPSKISWIIRYSIMDLVWDPYFYINRVSKLYKQLESAKPEEVKNIEREILQEHENYINNMRDVINFNSFIKNVISYEVAKEWSKDWNAWPTSFLLYHDFIQRFHDYDSLQVVKQKLQNALLFDYDYIRTTPTKNASEEFEKTRFLEKIKSFVSKYYPEIFKQKFSTEPMPVVNDQYL